VSKRGKNESDVLAFPAGIPMTFAREMHSYCKRRSIS